MEGKENFKGGVEGWKYAILLRLIKLLKREVSPKQLKHLGYTQVDGDRSHSDT